MADVPQSQVSAIHSLIGRVYGDDAFRYQVKLMEMYNGGRLTAERAQEMLANLTAMLPAPETPERWDLRVGDVLDVLPTLEAESFDAMLCDPPYGLEFMGRDWDKAVPGPDVWREVLRVLKPGAYALVFGGTRTWHRLAVALEDAGFELRDTVMYCYGSGFPKGHDVSKAIDKLAGAEREVVGSKLGRPGMARDGRNQRSGFDAAFGGQASGPLSTDITAPATPDAERWQGYGTALKPAWEPVLLVRKPTRLTYAQNALEHGTGALNIDGCRVPGMAQRPFGQRRTPTATYSGYAAQEAGAGMANDWEPSSDGRWPANLIHDGSDEVVDLFPANRPGMQTQRDLRTTKSRYFGADKHPGVRQGRNDTGSAARFFMTCPPDAARLFYTAKASTKERNAGLEGRNLHPTVKPLALTEYLAKLLLVPEREGEPRSILVPFSGSGSEVIGALKAGWDEAIGIEREQAYVELAEARIRHHLSQTG